LSSVEIAVRAVAATASTAVAASSGSAPRNANAAPGVLGGDGAAGIINHLRFRFTFASTSKAGDPAANE
jgi:hypothetical protein